MKTKIEQISKVNELIQGLTIKELLDDEMLKTIDSLRNTTYDLLRISGKLGKHSIVIGRKNNDN